MDLNVTSKRTLRTLRHFHKLNQHKMVRGFDTSSKDDFLSILLSEDDGNARDLLLICKFDEFGMRNSRLFIYEDDELISEHDGPDIIAVQRLLVEEHTFFVNIPGVWTMESKSKQCCRKLVSGPIKKRCTCGWCDLDDCVLCVLFCLFVMVLGIVVRGILPS